MSSPIAYFLTLASYGTWLPGDQRGWMEYQKGWRMPDPIIELEALARMTEDAKIFTPHQRNLVEHQVRDTCVYRMWVCHAVNCRTNHMHAVVSAIDTPARKVRADLKAWCTRTLKEDALPERSEKWWGKRGSIRWVLDNEGLNQVIRYTLDYQ